LTPDSSPFDFNLSTFAEEVGLDDPIAGNFMLVNADPA